MLNDVGRMSVPRPSDAFCSVVERELADARKRAYEVLKEDKPMPQSTKLSTDTAREFHRRILAGESLSKIAGEVWSDLGYLNRDSCRAAIAYKFNQLGLKAPLPTLKATPVLPLTPEIEPKLEPARDFVRVEDSRELVNHPPHYGGDTPYEVIKVLEAWYPDGIPFEEGNAIKYIARARHKEDEEQDLLKALWYLKRRLDKLMGESASA